MTKNKLQKMRSTSRIEKMRLLSQTKVQKGLWIKTKSDKALRSIGKDNLANKIRDCRRGALCGSFYCMNCRTRAAESLEARCRDHIKLRCGDDKQSAREHLRYMTILNDLVDFEIGSVKAAIEEARKDFAAIRRKFKKVWIQGAFEFELIDMDHLLSFKEGNEVKRKTLAAMMGLDGKHTYDRQKFGNKILLHYHALIDLNGTDPKAFKAWAKKRWNKHDRQTDIIKIRKNQTLPDLCKKISSYCFKNRDRSNLTFITSSWERGEAFTNGELGMLISIYSSIGKRGCSSLLIGVGLKN